MHQQFNLLNPTGHVMHQQFKLSKPTGHVMHQQFNLLKLNGYVMQQQFNIQQLYVLPTLYLCVLYLSENKQRLVPLNSINWLAFITEMKSVYCAVRTGSLTKAVCASYLMYISLANESDYSTYAVGQWIFFMVSKLRFWFTLLIKLSHFLFVFPTRHFRRSVPNKFSVSTLFYMLHVKRTIHVQTACKKYLLSYYWNRKTCNVISSV